MDRLSPNLVGIVLNGVEIEYYSQKFIFSLYSLSGGEGGLGRLRIRPPIGTYGPDASIIAKFGLNTS